MTPPPAYPPPNDMIHLSVQMHYCWNVMNETAGFMSRTQHPDLILRAAELRASSWTLRSWIPEMIRTMAESATE